MYRDAHLVYIRDATCTDREVLFEPDTVSHR
jgi:hypothetical protein